VRPAHQDLRGNLDAHPDQLQKLRAHLAHQPLELTLNLGLLECEVFDPARGGP
jgi:hypothetical protein